MFDFYWKSFRMFVNDKPFEMTFTNLNIKIENIIILVVHFYYMQRPQIHIIYVYRVTVIYSYVVTVRCCHN